MESLLWLVPPRFEAAPGQGLGSAGAYARVCVQVFNASARAHALAHSSCGPDPGSTGT